MMTPAAFALLRLSLVKGVGPARLRKALAHAHGRSAELAELVAGGGLGDVLGPEQLDELAANLPTAELLAERLNELGVTVTGLADPSYPAALAQRFGLDRAPPLLLTRGNAALLHRPSVGFCGSRQASDRGLRVAEDCASQLSASGVVVTSGYAAGVDMCAHTSALVSGGQTTIVLAEGIVGFRIKPEIEAVWSWDRVCVVSEFAATAPWSAGNAMQRNRTIIGLSRAMILIEARATGGSVSAGRDALAANVPLFAADYDGMPEAAVGNRELIKQGATPLLRNRATMRASLDGVLGAVRADAASLSSTGASQMRLLS